VCSEKFLNKKLLGVCCWFFLAGSAWAQNDGYSSESIRVVSEPGYEYSERIINFGEPFTDQDEAEAGTDLLDEDDQPVSGMSIILIKQAIDLAAARDVGADFSGVDASFQAFIDNAGDFDGISYVLVDAEGVIHQKAFGDHTNDTVVLLASTSKVPAVMTLMALQEDPNVDFSISEPVSAYLSYDGPYANRTVEQMVSNTSGIPGLRLLLGYGSFTGPTIADFNHLCQFSGQLIFDFETCGQTLVQNELLTTQPAGSVFDYGGSQWQIAGVTASVAADTTWNELVDRYFGTPCGLDVFTFGNPWESPTSFTGSVESLRGSHNPNIEGGAITNMADYAKLLQIHLNGGYCGDTQVLSEEAIASMQLDRGGVVATNATPYGMGWWIRPENPGVFTDPGAFGAVSFIDVNRGIGGYMAIDQYDDAADSNAPPTFFIGQAIPAIQAAWDAAQ
jgi:CubicO group peptidase (beta-lactamase class C family)